MEGFYWLGLMREITEFHVAPELSATTGGIRDKEDGACAECIPSSPGNGVGGFHQHHPTDAVNHPQERGIADSSYKLCHNLSAGRNKETPHVPAGKVAP